MKSIVFLFISLALFIFSGCGKRSGKPRVLVFSKTTGFYHTSIPVANAALLKLGADNDFTVDTTTNSAWFTEDSLKKYAAVIFLNTTGDVLNSTEEAELERYVQSGGGFVGVHSATDTEYDWGWYGRMVGGYFESHPVPQEAVLRVMDSNHAATKGLPSEWRRKDEWYNFKKLNKDVKVLLAIDESSYQGGKNGNMHPMAWYHEYDGGRAFYTELGHTDESYSEPQFLKHLLGGIRYAIGENEELDYAEAKTPKVPEEDRFVKKMLTQGEFYEPTEMTILPSMDILIAQRRGPIMRYSNKDGKVKQVGFLNAYYQTTTPGVNAEEGILGMAADPNFKNNNYIYLFYSPADTSVNRLSRFEYKNDTIDNRTEKVILQFYSQRNICCHTGGSIAFGNDNILYLSTGDNSTPFDEPKQPFVNRGFSPQDDRPGHEQYDARRSSGNTADLRGKILRIRIKPDGTYDIPQGNLFPGNDPKARPEIFVMGNRNPYRISVDKKTGFLYWGEVGPDANNDSLDTRGPRGYDEVNQARKAGFFGWPLFVGNNYAYRQYDYGTGASGDFYDPARPVNASRNNTGLQQLPPAQPAFIWYPYAPSPDFPGVGTGGRNAMAGPVYYANEYPKDTRYPDYFHGKLFIYDWIRNWVKVVRMLPNGDFDKMDAFLQNVKFSNPIDMEAGPDGRIYILEYGSGWFSKNADAGLSRIEYIAGNRPPRVDSLKVARESGPLPFTVDATVQAKDPEGDGMRYRWTIGDTTIETAEPRLRHTINRPGEYTVGVEVADDEKASNKSTAVTVYAGNTQPILDIMLQGSRSFYFPGKPVVYDVQVRDEGDSVNKANLYISTEYVQNEREAQTQGHQVVTAALIGKNIMLNSDCKGCHKETEKSIGPSYLQVAQKYGKNPDAQDYLVQKIIKGSRGVWGEAAMPAHPSMKEADAQQIVQWILTLGGKDASKKSLPTTGSLTAKPTDPKKSVLAINATYTDAGGRGVGPLSASRVVYLRNSMVDVSVLGNRITGFDSKDSAGNRYLLLPTNEGILPLRNIDFSGIRGIELTAFGNGAAAQYAVEVRIGDKNGQKVGEGQMAFSGTGKVTTIIPVQGAPAGQVSKQVAILFRRLNGSGTRPLLKTIRFLPQ